MTPYAGHPELFADLRALGEALLRAALLAPGASEPQEGLAEAADERWAGIAARMAATRQAGIFIPWIHLTQLFQLDRVEQQLLLAALLSEIDARWNTLLKALGDDGEAQGKLPLAVAARLFGAVPQGCAAMQQALASDAALRHWQLVELQPGARVAALTGSLQLPPAVSAYLHAESAPQLRLVDALPGLTDDTALMDHLASPATLERLGQFVARCGPQTPANFSYLLHLQGPDAHLLESLCGATFARLGLACARLDGRQIRQVWLAAQRSIDELRQLLRALCRDALLSNRVLVISQPQELLEGDGRDDAAAEVFKALFETLFESQRYCAVLNGPAARLTDLAHSFESHPVVPVQLQLSAPDATLRRRIWQSLGLALEPALLDRLVNNYLFTETQIRQILKEAAAQALVSGASAAQATELLLQACREQNNAERLAIAKEVKTAYRLDDIILAPRTRGWLDEVLQYAQHRHLVLEQWGLGGLGAGSQQNSKNLCVLFHGPSGTGKTMAASIVANELGLGLFKIDLSSVLSKYIGETEKHLAQLFDRAESMNIVLFFDEAESLFAKRTETKDAHDRYANLQTGYLLQRIETYPGLVILSTNLMKNMDKAFTRRFKFTLEFGFPSAQERLQLWRKALPATLPRSDDIDFELLAERVAVSGGHIHNIALSAAFYAAAEQQPLAWRHLLQAIEREYDKLGKVFATADFSWGDDE